MRLEVSRRTDLALAVLRALNAARGSLAGHSLAVSLGTSPTYLASAVAPLVARGWVSSRPGRSGGYEITSSGGCATVLDVLEAIEGPIDDEHCVLEGRPCGVEPCVMHEAWSRARCALRQALASEAASGV